MIGLFILSRQASRPVGGPLQRVCVAGGTAYAGLVFTTFFSTLYPLSLTRLPDRRPQIPPTYFLASSAPNSMSITFLSTLVATPVLCLFLLTAQRCVSRSSPFPLMVEVCALSLFRLSRILGHDAVRALCRFVHESVAVAE